MKIAKDMVYINEKKNIDIHMHFIKKIIHDRVIKVIFFHLERQVVEIFINSPKEENFSKL
jgi:hypothetical protein